MLSHFDNQPYTKPSPQEIAAALLVIRDVHTSLNGHIASIVKNAVKCLLEVTVAGLRHRYDALPDCPTCHGAGWLTYENIYVGDGTSEYRCPTCMGQGKTEDRA